MNTPNIIEHLKTRFQQKTNAHPSFKLMEIDNSLFPNGIIIPFETEAKDSNNKLRTVKDIVADSWKKGEKNHLMIQGEGGIGKTVTLLSLPMMFDDYTAPAIYIPLHELKGSGTDDMIENYIKKRVLDDDEELFLQLKELRKMEWDNGPCLLLLLDGFNEIPIELRGAISENIEQWSEYSGIQLITSSRFDIHQYVYLRSYFSKIELQPLSEDTVLTYLENNGIDTPKSSAITKLITIPLLLTLYIKTETIRREQPAPFTKFLETKNAGTLIWNYLQSELRRFKNQDLSEAKACVLAMEFIAPYIAWTMQKQSEFILDESVFLDRIDEAYGLMETHHANKDKFPPHIKTTLQKSKGLPNSEYVGLLLSEQLSLFVGFSDKDEKGNDVVRYRLMHQQFRDALAAMHLINSIYLSSNTRPTEWNSTVDHYVMQFVADLISEDEANRLWEQNRTSPQLESATRNQLELQRRLHNCDFSKLNFSGLDLSSISLYPYRVGNTMLKLPTSAEAMDKVKLSDITFSPEGHTNYVLAVAVTSDSKRIVSGSLDNTIRVWDMETGACLKTLEGHTLTVNAVAVTSDGKRIVSGSNDKTIRVWDLETGACLKTLEGHTNEVTAVAVTTDGNCIVSGSRDSTIRVWDIETSACQKILEWHRRCVNAVAVTSDGKRIVSGSDDYTIRVWDLETGMCIRTLIGDTDEVTAVAVTSDGKRIVSGSWNAIRVWDMETRACLKTLEGHKGFVNAVAVTSDSKLIVSGSNDHTVRVWDLEKGTCLKTLEGHEKDVTAVAVTSDGKRIVSGSRDSTVRVWDMETGSCLKSLEGHTGYVEAVAVTTDGNCIVSGSGDRTIRVWDMETVACLKTLEGHLDEVWAVAVTSDGKRIVSGSRDSIVRVWDMETGACLKTLEGHTLTVTAVALTSDGKRIVSGSRDSTIRVWDMETGACLKTLKGYKDWDLDWVTAMAVTSDSKRIVNGSERDTIRVWDLDTAACLKTLERHSNDMYSVAVTSDGKRIVSGSRDSTVRVWDMETGSCLKTLEGHMDSVTAVAVTSDGKRIVSGSCDNTIRVWDMDTGACIKTLEGHTDYVIAVAVTFNGKRIVSGSGDNTICIWDLESGECITTIRIHPLSLVGLDFSKAIISTPELKEQLRQNGAIV